MGEHLGCEWGSPEHEALRLAAERRSASAQRGIATRRARNPSWGRNEPTAQSIAHKLVRCAVRNGFLKKLDGSVACVDCGKPAESYDHRDYSKPLDVEPVCQGCNVRRGQASRKAA